MRVARLVGRRARAVWLLTFVVLAACAAFVPTLNEDPVPQTDTFLTEVDSVKAQDILDAHFPSDESSPAIVVAATGRRCRTCSRRCRRTTGSRRTASPTCPPDRRPAPHRRSRRWSTATSWCSPTLEGSAESAAAADTVRSLRTDLDPVGTDVLVGGNTAIQLDARDTTDADRARVIPAILLVIFVVLALLLRSLAAPLLLVLANVLSFGATIGISALVFNHVFGFPASDPSISLIGFVFLVALGIDYSIFLMTRVREESVRQGTHPGVLKGLSVTGGVITSAGVVLAATFAALGVLPILFLARSRSSWRSACCSTPWSCGRCSCRRWPTTSGRASGGRPGCGTPPTRRTTPPPRCCTSASATASSWTTTGSERRPCGRRPTSGRRLGQAGRVTRTRIVLLVLLALVGAGLVLALVRAGDRPARAVAAPTPVAVPTDAPAAERLRAWDAQRSAAYAAGSVRMLRDLYVAGSRAGRADVRLLRA